MMVTMMCMRGQALSVCQSLEIFTALSLKQLSTEALHLFGYVFTEFILSPDNQVIIVWSDFIKIASDLIVYIPQTILVIFIQ